MPSARRKATNRGVVAQATRVKTEGIKHVKEDTDDDASAAEEPQMSKLRKPEPGSEAEDMKPTVSTIVKAERASTAEMSKSKQKRARHDTPQADDASPIIKQESKAEGSKVTKKRKIDKKESSPSQSTPFGSRNVRAVRERAQTDLQTAGAIVKRESSSEPRKLRTRHNATPFREQSAPASPAVMKYDDAQDSETVKKANDSEQDDLQSQTENMDAGSHESVLAPVRDRKPIVKSEVNTQVGSANASSSATQKDVQGAKLNAAEEEENVAPRYTRKEKGKGRAKQQDSTDKESVSLKIELERLKKQLQAAHATLESQRGALDKINELHTCNICLETLRNPLALSCGHVFCQNDLWNWFHRSDGDEEHGYDSDDLDSYGDFLSGSNSDGDSGSDGDDIEFDGTSDQDSREGRRQRHRPTMASRDADANRYPTGVSGSSNDAHIRRSTGSRGGLRMSPSRGNHRAAGQIANAFPTGRRVPPARAGVDLYPVADDVDTDDSNTDATCNTAMASATLDNGISSIRQTVTFPRVLASQVRSLPTTVPTAAVTQNQIAQAPAAAAAAAAAINEQGSSATAGPSHRIPARNHASWRNLVCPHCRMKISVPPFPVFMVREISDIMRARSTGRRESSLDLERANDAIQDPTWGGLFPRVASPHGRIDRNVYYRPVGPGSVEPRAFAVRTAGAGQTVRQTGQMLREDREHEQNVARVQQRLSDAQRRLSTAQARTRRAAARQARPSEFIFQNCTDRERRSHEDANDYNGEVPDGSPDAQVARHPIAAVARRANEGAYGRDVNRYGMRDAEDGVRRCVDCNWEIENGCCGNCGIEYDSDSEFDDAGDEVDQTATSPQCFGASHRVHQTSETNQEEEGDLSDFIVSDGETPPKLGGRRRTQSGTGTGLHPKLHTDSDEGNDSDGKEVAPASRSALNVSRKHQRIMVNITDDEGEDVMADKDRATDCESAIVSSESEVDSDAVVRVRRANRSGFSRGVRKKRNPYAYSSEEEVEEEMDEDEEEDEFIDDTPLPSHPERNAIVSSEEEAEETDRDIRRARREERRQARDAHRISRSRANESESDFSDEDSESSSSTEGKDDDIQAQISVDTQHTSLPDDDDSEIEVVESQATSRQKREMLAAAAEKRLARQAEAGDIAAMSALARSNVEKRNKVSGSHNRSIVNAFHDHVSHVVRKSAAHANASSSVSATATRPGYKKRVIDESEED